MGGILQVDTIQNNNTSNLITQTNVTTITIGTTGQTISLAGGASSSGFGATYNSGLNWTSTLVTSALTVSAGTGYFVNTSTAAITITLPSTPTFGNIVGINDYSGHASTNNITVNPNGNKLEGGTANKLITTNKESVILNYVDSTRGWLATSGVNNGTDALEPNTYSIDFLVIAGGGGGAQFGGGGGAGGFRTSTQTAEVGTVITVTVGDGGAGSTDPLIRGTSGSNSSISGSGLTTITSAGGGGGASGDVLIGGSGGSGGGSSTQSGDTGGSGNTPSTSPSQGNNGGGTSASNVSGGGGGAGAVGANNSGTNSGAGGNGTANSITGSSVTRAGGGGGGARGTQTSAGSGGTGGGGNGTKSNATGGAGTTNTGSGGGGGGYLDGPGGGYGVGGAGGKGVVILSVPTTKYSSTTTGSPTVTTSGANTIMQFNGSGSYTA